MTPNDAARAAASKGALELIRQLRNSVGRNHAWDDHEMLPLIDAAFTSLLAERDATIAELQREVGELKRELSELEAAIERHY